MQARQHLRQPFIVARQPAKACHPGETALNGLIINDKFCLSRWGQLQLAWPRSQRIGHWRQPYPRCILPMRSLIAEELMKRQWNISRTTAALPNGQQRWDQAYQLLLQWAQVHPPVPTPTVPTQAPQEVSDASSSVRPCLDQPSSSASDD